VKIEPCLTQIVDTFYGSLPGTLRLRSGGLSSATRRMLQCGMNIMMHMYCCQYENPLF